MEYGRIAEGDIARVDIGLPMDHPANSLVLKGGHAKSRIYMGAPKWGAKEWIGNLYPKRTKDAEFLEQYVKHYNAVELNATHYHIQPSESIAKWAAKAGGHDFLFCPKFIKTVSHGSFNNTANLTAQFLESVSGFGVHLGPIFLQLSERYEPGNNANCSAIWKAFQKICYSFSNYDTRTGLRIRARSFLICCGN